MDFRALRKGAQTAREIPGMARSLGSLHRIESGLGQEKAEWVVIGVDANLGEHCVVFLFPGLGSLAGQVELRAVGPGSET